MDSDLNLAGQKGIAMVAMGGHAFIRPGEKGTVEEHLTNAVQICDKLMTLVSRGYDLVITHGNGPQVGQQLIKNELTRDDVPSWPMDVLVAETEGSLGYILQQAILNHLRRHDINRYVVTFICQVLVDIADHAFTQPSTPIGPFLTRQEAEERRDTIAWLIAAEQGRGWRRVVPSSRPQRVVQWRMIQDAVRHGHIVIACGGGGIPVVLEDNGDFCGVEAVIDKDFTTSMLGQQIGAEFLIILSDVPNVFVHFGTPQQRALNAVTMEEVERYISEGHFPDGSMGPKVKAMFQFLNAGGRRGLITSPDCLPEALEGRAGTHFIGKL